MKTREPIDEKRKPTYTCKVLIIIYWKERWEEKKNKKRRMTSTYIKLSITVVRLIVEFCVCPAAQDVAARLR